MTRLTTLLTAAVIAITGTSCATEDTAEDTTATTDSAPAMADMAHDSTMMGSTQHAQPRDADHEFLMMMSSHHEGLIQMATAAHEKASAQQTREDAGKLHTKQRSEQDSMVSMIQRDYQMSHQPMVMPKNRAQADSLAALSGPEYDRAFYRMVIAHHREGIGMIDQFLPRFTKPSVRSMAEMMRRDQQREIDEFQAKVNAQ